MRIITEWEPTVQCQHCATILEIEMSDIYHMLEYDHTMQMTVPCVKCMKCDEWTPIEYNILPEGLRSDEAIRKRFKHSVLYEKSW